MCMAAELMVGDGCGLKLDLEAKSDLRSRRAGRGANPSRAKYVAIKETEIVIWMVSRIPGV